ncbi:MAG: oxidoreductase [Actinobacteria bacterium]|nr:oxidoreductase [Actinomycetota bacterium]
MKEKYMIIDVAKCHDCNNCFIACQDEHAENDWAPYQAAMPRHGHRWMDILRHERGQNDRIDTAFLPKPCLQCENPPPCAAGGDFVGVREDGIVIFDLEAGRGRDITASCPYGAIWWNEEEQLSQKCDFCAHLLDDPAWEPGVPRCVHTCPTGALTFVVEEPVAFARRIQAEGLAPYKEEIVPKPHVWYKNLHRFTKNFVAGQVLKGGDVASGVTVVLRGADSTAELVSDMFGEFRFDGLSDGEYTLTAEGKELTEVTVLGASVDAGDFEI